MRPLAIIPILLLALAGCLRDETVAGYGGADHVWHLIELDGAPFTARATLGFPAKGRIAGQAPCNSYETDMTAPYPWFETGSITATEIACPDLMAEERYLAALADMSLAEISGPLLLLSNDQGQELLFKASGPAP